MGHSGRKSWDLLMSHRTVEKVPGALEVEEVGVGDEPQNRLEEVAGTHNVEEVGVGNDLKHTVQVVYGAFRVEEVGIGYDSGAGHWQKTASNSEGGSWGTHGGRGGDWQHAAAHCEGGGC